MIMVDAERTDALNFIHRPVLIRGPLQSLGKSLTKSPSMLSRVVLGVTEIGDNHFAYSRCYCFPT